MDHELRLLPFETAHMAGVMQLSRRLENDPTPCSFWGLDREAANQLLHHPTKRTFVALFDTAVVGLGTLTQGTSYQQHLGEVSVAVCPQYRRVGIARGLLQYLEIAAQAQHIELLKALIWTENVPSRCLFESLNFEHKATLYCEFKSREFGEIDDCVYYKRLTS